MCISGRISKDRKFLLLLSSAFIIFFPPQKRGLQHNWDITFHFGLYRGVDVRKVARSRDNQNFSHQSVTTFSYQWCSARAELRYKTPADIALGVVETRKPPHCIKVVILSRRQTISRIQGSFLTELSFVDCLQIELLWRRATGDLTGRFYCLVNADQLDFTVSKQAVDMLSVMTQGLAGKTGEREYTHSNYVEYSPSGVLQPFEFPDRGISCFQTLLAQLYPRPRTNRLTN